ncbi:MAG TPA: iron-containing alcohol dehydrogenase [bacterium]|nr:iron-containing alcohol dehydrogenase [bacterium]
MSTRLVLTPEKVSAKLEAMKSFRFLCHPEVVAGDGALALLPEKIKALGGLRILLVVDPFLRKTEKVKNLQEKLVASGFHLTVYDGFSGEPTTEQGDDCASWGKKQGCNIVVGLGGGSVLDTAKAAAVLITNGGSVRDYQGLNRVPGPGLPTIMVPTTAGTGSEVTFTAVFVRREERKKAGINSPYLYPQVAILDPELTVTMSPAVTASTGLDALCHALESYTSQQANFVTEAISRQAVSLIWKNLPRAFADGASLEARRAMLYGSFLAGLGLANAGVTAVHAISYPLGGRFGLAHGVANGLLLPYVLEFNLPEVEDKIGLLAVELNPTWTGKSRKEAACDFVQEIKAWLTAFQIPRLKNLGISPEVFPELAKDALLVSVPIQNNPRPITAPDIVSIYQAAW